MVKANSSKKKVKSVSSTISSPPRPGSSANTVNNALRSIKFKYHAGKYSASNRTIRSDVNAGPSLPDTQRPVRLEDFVEMNGWDPQYIQSFLENDTLPPQTDPELPKLSRANKVLHEWKKEAEKYLSSMITLEGRGSDANTCPGCKSTGEGVVYRCLTCDGGGLWCSKCVLATHRYHPLHRIQVWTGDHFTKCSLKMLGLRIQLGHSPGDQCPLPITPYNDDFFILDVDQIHSVGLDFCGCGRTGKTQVAQLLERRLYPATITSPKTAATFRLLEVLELLQYESKISTFEFFQSVSRLTCNTGLEDTKDRYPSLLRMIHQWRYLKLLKRSGRGHDPTRPASHTKPGECAVLCPACPQPAINLPEGWENEPEETQYIHGLNLALDCNMRLKRKNVSNTMADPSLNQGCAYFVDDAPFREFLKKHVNEVEPKSTCSRHDAVNLADSRPGHGYAASGVGTVECARHNSKRPNAVCDTQKGEKYCNMDYITVLSLYLVFLKFFLISYDIACQWYIHLMERITEIDKSCVLLRDDTTVRFVVPKFHLPAHISACRDRFAFMITPGAGLGDGEAPERGWSETNALGPSTREMGPGSRSDTLDAHFGDYNWRKVTAIGTSLLKKMKTATSDVAEHVIAHQELEATLQKSDIDSWIVAVRTWEKDPTQPNPYELRVKTPTQAAVRRQLAEEETQALADGTDFTAFDEISPSELISYGIDIEIEQRALKGATRQVWDHSQDRQLTRIQLRSNALTRKLDAWYQRLQLHIPGVAHLRKKHESPNTVPPHEIPLWLPSQIGKQLPCNIRLATIEYRLREAQAHEALGTLRRNLQMRASLYDVKDRWLRGQGANTRALNAIASVQGRIDAAVADYRRAREALLSLATVLGYEKIDETLLVLKNEDIRSMSTPDDGKGETRRTISWIWRQGDANEAGSDSYIADTVRVEWAKSRARAQRHLEEIKIVKEEMNRTIRFFEWKEKQWNGRATAGLGGDAPETVEGLRAYAMRQASIARTFVVSLREKWNGVDSMVEAAAKEARLRQNHYQYLKRKAGSIPELTQIVRNQAAQPFFSVGWELEFSRFRETQGILCLDSFEIGEEELEKMIGLPPYTVQAIQHPDFEKNWDQICAALNGLSVRRAIADQQAQLEKYRRQPLSQFVVDTRLRHEQLTREWKKTQLASLSDEPAALLACVKVIWIARELVYITEDLAALAEGNDKYMFQLCERTHYLERRI
ncbi:hypothetical protein MD484_g5955, partial [Candolleomyces efflorescens]